MGSNPILSAKIMNNLSHFYNRYRYELVAFITSAVLLSVEITGGRLLAPYFGLSSYVWTAMIGTILSFLSLGYWLGGRVADRDNPTKDIGIIIALGGFSLLISNLLTEPVLSLINGFSLDTRVSALLSAGVLFGPASLLIGFITPHLAKIRVTSLKTSGESIGRLEAASALGSIFGTFVSGYVLLGYFGSRDIGIFLSLILILSSFIAESSRLFWGRMLLAVAGVLLLLIAPTPAASAVLLDTDTAHARYKVLQGKRDGQPFHYLLTDGQSIQSGVFPDSPDSIVLDYGRRINDVIARLSASPDSLAIIGGAVHSLPRQYASVHNISRVVSVEIDPALDEIARSYFGHTGDTVETIYEDGRTFLKNSAERFDVIIMDAFSATTPPFHLTTKEATAAVQQRLQGNGVFISNIISRYPDGYMQSAVATQASVFEDVIVITDGSAITPNRKQNFIVVAGDTEIIAPLRQAFASSLIPVDPSSILTDDFAPVERLTF